MVTSKILVSFALITIITGSLMSAEKSPKKQSKQKTERFSCGGKPTCKKMNSCDEAMFHLNECGVKKLDRDHDGIPCESLCG